MSDRIEEGIDPGEAARLGQRAGWTWTERGIARIVDLQPEGAWTARGPDGQALGVVTCVVWDRVAWIGSLVVDEAARGRGTGRALLHRALAFADARADVVGLDSTPAARRLYETEGFRAVGESAIWTRTGAARGAPATGSGDYAIYPVSPAEIMELVAYDTPRFGVGRGRYLAALVAESQHRSFVAVHRKTGAFSGHALAHDPRLGTLVADTPEAAAWLLHAAERAGAPGVAVVPDWNPAATALFRGAGYVRGRACTRMARGGPLPGRPDATYALGAWALG